VRRLKSGQSRVFEQQNLERLKKCSDTISRAEKAIREADQLVQESLELTQTISQAAAGRQGLRKLRAGASKQL